METKIIRVTDKGQISLPVNMRESMDIEKGDELIVVKQGDKILIEKIGNVTKKIEDDFADLLEMSERTMAKVWDNEEDDIWDSYLKK